jgi:hypothetical protein
LLDRHHVHRAKPIDLGAQPGDGVFRGQRADGFDAQGGAETVSGNRRHRIEVDWTAKGVDVRCITRRAFVVLDAIVHRKGTRIRRRRACAFELVYFGDHVFERGLHGLQTGRRKVRQIAFRRRTGNLQLARRGADRVQICARIADGLFFPVHLSAQGTGCRLSSVNVTLDRVEFEHGGVKPGQRFGGLDFERGAPIGFLRAFRGQRRQTHFHLARRIVEPRDLGGQCGAPLDERGVRGLRLCDPRGKRFDTNTRIG